MPTRSPDWPPLEFDNVWQALTRRGPPPRAATVRWVVGLLRRPLQRPELASLGGLVVAFAVFSILRPDLFLSRTTASTSPVWRRSTASSPWASPCS